MKSRLQAAKYPSAWTEYDRRFYTAWIVPLLILLCYLGTALPKDSRQLTWVLISAVVAYTILYIRFIRWPCPRCGKRFTMPDPRRIIRSKKCSYCGLPRNAAPPS